jgi:hypothetical protein
LANLFLSHWRWIAGGGTLVAVLAVVTFFQSSTMAPEYYIAANSSYGRITLISTRSTSHTQARIPGLGAISSVAVFKGNLVLCSSYGDADASNPDPARGLWTLSLLDGEISRRNETLLSGPVYMCTVLDGSLWILEGSKLWSTTDLQHFELRNDDVRTALVVSPSTVVIQHTSGTLSWIKVEAGAIEHGALGRVDHDVTIDTMFGNYAFFNNWSVLHLSVPNVDQFQEVLSPARDTNWAFRAFFDTRYNNWITVRNSVARVSSVSRVSVKNDSKIAFTVRGSRIVHVIQISEHEFDVLRNIASTWKAK